MTSRNSLLAVAFTLLSGSVLVSGNALAQQAPAAPSAAPAVWLASLKTDTPQAGYELAVKLSRAAVRITQPDAGKRQKSREQYEQNAASLVAVSHVVAVNFATVAAANNYWKDR